MSQLRIFFPKLFVLLYLSLGRTPRIVTLLELLHTPSIARVMLTRRRRLEYTEFFTLLDRDGRRAAPIVRSSVVRHGQNPAEDTAQPEKYIRVSAA